MSSDDFRELVSSVCEAIGDRPLDAELDRWLNQQFGPESPTYQQLKKACVDGVAEGWMCKHEAGGIRFGRVIKPTPELRNFSVDVVDMNEIVGPHHVHPNGEIDLIMPIEGEARFDGRPAGWCVYPPGSAHKPTVKGGRALVLYLLPEGSIEFTRSATA